MNNLPRIIAIAFFTITLAAFAKEPIGELSVTAAELAAMISGGDAPFILDVRTKQEYDAGHIPGAVNISHTELEERIAELTGQKNDTIVLHCRSGKRAQTADEILHRNGFTKITELEGHMLGWEEDGHPVE